MANTTRAPRHTIRLIGLLAIFALFAGCASAPPDRPDWIDGISKKYSKGLYLTGRGEGPSVDLAKDRARADLAKILTVKVEAQSRDTQTFESNASGSQSSLSVERDIRTYTDKVIKGVTIAEMWQDKDAKTHYALAILNRNKAATALEKEIRELDATTKNYLDAGAKKDDKLAKVGFLTRALRVQYQRAEAQRTLVVVDNTGKGVPSKFNIGELTSGLNELTKSIRIKTVITKGDDVTLHPIFAGGISAAGFTESTKDAHYTLEGALDVADLGEKDGWMWYRGTFSVKLLDPSGGVHGSKRWQVKASATDKPSALMRVHEKVAKSLKSDLSDVLTGFAEQ